MAKTVTTRKRTEPDGNKNIIVLSDGTGNSSNILNKTNVWRIFQSLNLNDKKHPQVAKYDDGVGTSAFKPLRYLGGAFGYGLKQNVCELYAFVALNYQPGDKIYGFGFSRGAYTIRMLMGLIGAVGLPDLSGVKDEQRVAVANQMAKLAYVYFRTEYFPMIALPIFPWLGRFSGFMLNKMLGRQPASFASARKGGNPPMLGDVPIHFIGVFDTVAAHGLPIDELTTAWAYGVWPIQSPDYDLGNAVSHARHALALDDERHTFHPKIWNENELRVANSLDGETAERGNDRLKQVWFAGVHSNIGGSYAEDGLAYIPFEWMVHEAAAKGLRFLPHKIEEYTRQMDVLGRLYNPRAGAGGTYRYKPRLINDLAEKHHREHAFLGNRWVQGFFGFYKKLEYILTRRPEQLQTSTGKPETFIYGDLGEGVPVKVHASVFERIARSRDGYGPLALPGNFEVVHTNGCPPSCMLPPPRQFDVPAGLDKYRRLPHNTVAAMPHLARHMDSTVGDLIWRRRLLYFASVLTGVLLLALPFAAECELFGLAKAPQACAGGPFCIIGPLISLLDAFLPDFVNYWLDAFRTNAAHTVMLLMVAVAFIVAGVSLEHRVRATAGRAWKASLTGKDAASLTLPESALYRLRNAGPYKDFFRFLTAVLFPFMFIAVFIYAGFSAFLWVASGVNWGVHEWANGPACNPRVALRQADNAVEAAYVDSRRLCTPLANVRGGQQYLITLKHVPVRGEAANSVEWSDGGIEASLVRWGSPASSFANRLREAVLKWGFIGALRKPTLGLYEPVLQIGSDRRHATGVHQLVDNEEKASYIRRWQAERGTASGTTLTFRFKPDRDGPLFFYINDAIPPAYWPPAWRGGSGWLTTGGFATDGFYLNNAGALSIQVRPE